MAKKKKQDYRPTSIRETLEELSKFDYICSRYGMDRTTGIRMCIRYVNRTGVLPIVPIENEDLEGNG